MILQTLFLLKRYGNSTIFTRDIYNADNAYRTSCMLLLEHSLFDNVRRCDAIRYALGCTLLEDSCAIISNFERKNKKRRQCVETVLCLGINFTSSSLQRHPHICLTKLMIINYNVIFHPGDISSIFSSIIIFLSHRSFFLEKVS